MSNIAGSSIYSSANTSTSTLRPRNNRLISYLEDTPSDNDVSPQTASRSTSRGSSPASTQTRGRNLVQPSERLAGQAPARAPNDVAGRRSSTLWDSWTSIQGVASSLLSGGESSTSVGRKGSIKTPVWMKQDPRFKTATATSEWGPTTKDTSASQPGSIEDRQALVQAKKREALLLSCAQEGRDQSGRFKRKASYDGGPRAESTDPDSDEAALVYKHIVRPSDTLAGVTIKYSCQPEAFRKINRFWPNDNIQTRKYVLLPVEFCGVRGKKVDDITSLDLLANRLNNVKLDSNTQTASSGEQIGKQPSSSLDTPPIVDTPNRISPSEDEDYKHDSFVVLSSFADPVEILRIPRGTLGYFPRARRKSGHNNIDSITSTPKSSFDMLRHPPTHAAQQAAAALNPASYSQHSHSLNASPDQRSRPSISSRKRSSSTATTANTNAKVNNAWFLRGPGGVGSLRGPGTDVSRPGPAEDPLNQKFSQYLPSLAIQLNEEGVNGSNTAVPRHKTINASRSPYRSTPRASIDSVRSSRSNSSTFGVTGVESFMRKLATGSKRPDTGGRSNSGNIVNAIGIPLGDDTGLGDLIELETNPDALNSARGMNKGKDIERVDQDDEDGEATPTEVGKSHEDSLNERFPIRGRITRAYVGDEG